jgi:DNA-binding MarR family transcriptional regulator
VFSGRRQRCQYVDNNKLGWSKVSAVTGSLQDTAWAIKRIQARHQRLFREALAPLGVTLVQWDALRQMQRYPDASLHELAQLTYQSDQAFGTLATRMVARGLIERIATPGRAVRHRVTAKGEELRARGAAVVDATLAESFGALPEADRETLHRLLYMLLESHDSGTAAPPAVRSR